VEQTAFNAIVLTDATKSYGSSAEQEETRAIRGVTLTVRRGEFVSLTGPSGSGKSSLLNMMGCLDVPTSGRVFILGEPLDRKNEGYLTKLRATKIGFIFQSFNLIPRLTALQNVTLPMSLAGTRSRRDMEAKARELLADVGLKGKEDKFPNQLSGGEMQRVAIARALANDPQILLADEPTGNLDSFAGRQVMDILEQLNSKGVTLVLVTHDESLAAEAQVRVKMRDGRIEEVIRKEALPVVMAEELETVGNPVA
jgi:putative ABC transport system ATP-binding protein